MNGFVIAKDKTNGQHAQKSAKSHNLISEPEITPSLLCGHEIPNPTVPNRPNDMPHCCIYGHKKDEDLYPDSTDVVGEKNGNKKQAL